MTWPDFPGCASHDQESAPRAFGVYVAHRRGDARGRCADRIAPRGESTLDAWSSCGGGAMLAPVALGMVTRVALSGPACRGGDAPDFCHRRDWRIGPDISDRPSGGLVARDHERLAGVSRNTDVLSVVEGSPYTGTFSAAQRTPGRLKVDVRDLFRVSPKENHHE